MSAFASAGVWCKTGDDGMLRGERKVNSRMTSKVASFRSSRKRTKRQQKYSHALPAKDGKEAENEEKDRVKGPEVKKSIFPNQNFPVLVLNADYQPLSYLPLSIWPWQEAVKAYYLERVNILATYDNEIRSPSVSLKLPSVVCLRSYHKRSQKGTPAFTRFNVFLRDDFRCQYCNQRQRAQDLTFDHVVPKKHGGKCAWTNIVSACIRCNGKKGSKMLKDLPDMRLRELPVTPTMLELQQRARKFPPKYLHESWRDYLYWDTPLQP